MPMSDESMIGATVVIRKVITPAASFDVTTWVMSGDPPFASPVGSVFVVSAMPAPAATRHAAVATIPATRTCVSSPHAVRDPSRSDGTVVRRLQNNSCQPVQGLGPRQGSARRADAYETLMPPSVPVRTSRLQRTLPVSRVLPRDGQRSLERQRVSRAVGIQPPAQLDAGSNCVVVEPERRSPRGSACPPTGRQPDDRSRMPSSTTSPLPP